jgi:spore coat protein CotF
MQEKMMVTDALNSINAGLKSLADMISQTEDQQLRQTLVQMRNGAETCQHELYTIAKSKNYYQPAQKATPEEIMSIKELVTTLSNQSGQASQGGQAGLSGQHEQNHMR